MVLKEGECEVWVWVGESGQYCSPSSSFCLAWRILALLRAWPLREVLVTSGWKAGAEAACGLNGWVGVVSSEVWSGCVVGGGLREGVGVAWVRCG